MLKRVQTKDSRRVLIVFIAAFFLQDATAQTTLSPEALEAVPDLANRMTNDQAKVRADLLCSLIENVGEYDYIKFQLRYHLTNNDYSTILQHALPGLAEAFSENSTQTSQLLNVLHLITDKHRIVGADALVETFAKDADEVTTRQVVDILVKMKSPLATPYLLARLETEDPYKLYVALLNVVDVGAVEAIPRIIELLELSSENTRHWAIWALYQLDARDRCNTIYEYCLKNPSEQNPFILAVLAKWGDERVTPEIMRQLLYDDDDTTAIAEKMKSRLIEVQATPIEDAVIAFLASGRDAGWRNGSELNLKAELMGLLGSLHSRKAIPVLRHYLFDEHEFLAAKAAVELGTLEAKEAVPELVTLFNEGRCRSQIVMTLAQIGEPATIPLILKDLRERMSGYPRVKVLSAMGRISAPETYRRIQDTLIDAIPAMTAAEFFAHLSEQLHIKIVLSDSIRPEDANRIVSYSGEATALHLLSDKGIQVLNYPGYDHAVWMEKDRIYVLTVDEALDKWQKWLDLR